MITALKILATVAFSGLAVAALSVAGLLVMDLVRSVKRYRQGYDN